MSRLNSSALKGQSPLKLDESSIITVWEFYTPTTFELQHESPSRRRRRELPATAVLLRCVRLVVGAVLSCEEILACAAQAANERGWTPDEILLEWVRTKRTNFFALPLAALLSRGWLLTLSHSPDGEDWTAIAEVRSVESGTQSIVVGSLSISIWHGP